MKNSECSHKQELKCYCQCKELSSLLVYQRRHLG